MSSTLNTSQHTFKIKQLDNSRPLNIQKYIKVALFLKKRPDITSEQFQHHWAHQHADMLLSLKTWPETGTYRYSQFVQDNELKKIVQTAGLPVMEYDGCAEMWFSNIDDFFAIASDKDYQKALDDMKNFVSEADGEKIMVGYENLVFGEAAPGLGENGMTKQALRGLS